MNSSLASLSLQKKWLIRSAAIYVLLMLVGFYFEFYYIALLPFLLAFIYLAIYHLEIVWFISVFVTPLSVNMEDLDVGGISMYLPTEPILFGVLVLFILKLCYGKSIDKRIYRHPVTYFVYAYLLWMAFTCLTSEMPLVSIKFLTVRLWFIVSFYFLAAHIFQKQENIKKYFLLYLIPLCGVIIFTVIRHSQYGFDKDSSHWVMEPIFKDHTIYGALLAMYFPITVALLLAKKLSPAIKLGLISVFVILSIGLVLSYTRAAWVSLFGAAGVLLILFMGIRLRTLLLALPLLAGFLFFTWDDIQLALEDNKKESSDKLDEHFSSISNVSSDASNLERLNRWHCAIEMFKERPIVGWGPGTYQFVYAPFQRSSDRTIISTNEGDGGNAHSEYLGPMAEEGFPGPLLVLALMLAISQLAFKLYRTIKDRDLKIFLTAAYLGLTTYFIHGVLNNYLDSDKASVPFWGFTAILVAVDIFHSSSSNTNRKGSQKAAKEEGQL